MSNAELSLLNGINRKVQLLDESPIRSVASYGMKKDDVTPLWFGEASSPTPDFICQAACKSLSRYETKYTPNTGLPRLCQAIAHYQNNLFSSHLTSENISITVSGTNAVMIAAQSCLNPADKVVVIEPLFPTLSAIPEILGCEVVRVALKTKDRTFYLDTDELFTALNKAQAIIINSPSNPTGWIASKQLLTKILHFCRQRGIWIISDEVYSRHVFDRKAAPSFCELIDDYDRVIICNSFSKAWAMTGWRLGWLNIPKALIPTVRKLTEFNVSCASAFSQAGGLAAIEQGEDFVQSSVAALRQSRDCVQYYLGDIPNTTLYEMKATFYGFLKIEGLGFDSQPYLRHMIDQAKVGVAPGEAFGVSGAGHIRICHATQLPLLEPALERVREFILNVKPF